MFVCKEAAEHFGLQILDEDIHDKERGENIQRYLLLARSAIPSHSVPTRFATAPTVV